MKKSILFILVPVAVVVLALFLTGDSEEQRILDRLEQIRELAEVGEQESPLVGVARAKQLGNLFSTTTRYDLSTLGYGITEINSRKELTQRIIAGRSQLLSLELALLVPQVVIDGDHATVGITGTALGATHHGQGKFMDVHRVEIDLVRTDGDWLVSGGRHIRDERAAFSGAE